jgi:hypothetical protein
LLAEKFGHNLCSCPIFNSYSYLFKSGIHVGSSSCPEHIGVDSPSLKHVLVHPHPLLERHTIVELRIVLNLEVYKVGILGVKSSDVCGHPLILVLPDGALNCFSFLPLS